MMEEEKIIRVKTLKDSDPDLAEALHRDAEGEGGLTTKPQRTLRAEFSLVVLYGE